MSKSVLSITMRDIRQINWKHYMTRKVVVLAAFGCVGFIAEHYWHVWWFGKGGELLIGSVVEHVTFEIPLLEESLEAGSKRAIESIVEEV